MEFRKKQSFTGVTRTAEKVKTGSFNCAQSMIAICLNPGVLKTALEFVLTITKSKRRRDRHFEPFRLRKLKNYYGDGFIKVNFL